MAENLVNWLMGLISNPLLVVGLLLIFIATFLKSEKSAQSPKFKPATLFKKTFSPLPLWAYQGLILLGIIAAIAGTLQVGGLIPSLSKASSPNAAPVVNLAGIGYSNWGWNPQQVDLRTSATEGIEAGPDTPLSFFDVRVSALEAINDKYQVQVEVYANDTEFIGKTQMDTLLSGVTALGNVTPTSYVYDTLKDNWRVQTDWSDLTVYVNVYDQDGKKVVSTGKTHIKLAQENASSWWTSPPYANFVSIAYQVNDGEIQLMDLRHIENTGINVQVGDTLRVLEIWYRSWTADGTKSIFAEAYLSSGGFDAATHVETTKTVMMLGAHNLLGNQPFEWTVAPGKNAIVFTLSRNDGYDLSTVLDRLIIPLSVGSSSILSPLAARETP